MGNLYWLSEAQVERLRPYFPSRIPPLEWSTFWDGIIPVSGGRRDGCQAREARGYRPERAALLSPFRRILGQHRSTQRKVPCGLPDEARLTEDTIALP